MNYKIYGTFTNNKGFIYRTDTFIQFGESEQIIGSCVLCNPGSSELHNENDQKRLEEYDGEDNLVIHDEAKEDSTMKQLIKIIKGVKEIPEEGRFLIFNLFTLRNGNMDDALKQFKHHDIDRKLLYRDYEDYTNLKTNLPWVLIGWGCKNNSRLNKIKRQWLSDISESNLPNTGYEHKKSPHYYHPLPRIHSKKLEYMDYIISKLEKLVESDK